MRMKIGKRARRSVKPVGCSPRENLILRGRFQNRVLILVAWFGEGVQEQGAAGFHGHGHRSIDFGGAVS